MLDRRNTKEFYRKLLFTFLRVYIQLEREFPPQGKPVVNGYDMDDDRFFFLSNHRECHRHMLIDLSIIGRIGRIFLLLFSS